MIPARAAHLSFPLLFCALSCLGTTGTTPSVDTTRTTPAVEPRADTSFTPAEEGVLYGIGVGVGAQLQGLALSEAEAQEVARGLTAALLDEPGVKEITEQPPTHIESFWDTRLREVARIEEQAGQPYLEAAAQAPGAVQLESGMILTVIEEGVGESPETFDWVVVSFTGTLRDGTVVASTGDGEPLKRRLGQTVLCWQEALGMSAPGARLHAVCPPDLAYRHLGGPGIPGGAVVAFDLELLEVIPGEDPSL